MYIHRKCQCSNIKKNTVDTPIFNSDSQIGQDRAAIGNYFAEVVLTLANDTTFAKVSF